MEGKMPKDLDQVYPKLLEKSDIKDPIILFSNDQKSDLNVFKKYF